MLSLAFSRFGSRVQRRGLLCALENNVEELQHCPMVGSKSSRRSVSSNASASSKGSKGHRRKRKAQSAPSTRQLGRPVALPCHQTAPQASRSALLSSDPKMKVLTKFVHKVEAEASAVKEQTPQVSLMDEADSFGDEEPSRFSEWDSGSDLSPAMLGSRRASASSRRASAAYGGYSRRTSAAASSRRTSAAVDSRRTSASSYLGRRQSEETNSSLPKAAVLQTTFESIAERQPSYEKRRASFRPASASAVLQRPGPRPDREMGVVQVEETTRQLLDDAHKHQQQKAKLAMSLDEQLGLWMAKRDDDVKQATAAAYQASRSWRSEHEALEDKRKQFHFFNVKGVKENFLNRAGHSLRKLFVDFDLAHQSGGKARTDEARCKHLDGVYDWYEKHASLKSQPLAKPEEIARPSPWIVVKHGEAPPPGSLRRPRSAAATFAGTGGSSFHASPPIIGRALSAPSLSP